MRRIISKEKQAEKDKRNQMILGIILVVVMFGSVFGIVVNSFGNNQNSENKIIYNGIVFIKNNDYWFTSIGDINFVFKYNPFEIKNITGEVNSIEDYSQNPLYISSKNKEAELEIFRNFQNIALRIQDACYKECEGDLPIKTCEDNFIIIKESNTTGIFQNNSCVYITGPKENLTEITDEFLFKVLRIKR